MAKESLDLKVLANLSKKACKYNVYVDSPLGGTSSSYGSFTLKFSGTFYLHGETKRLSLAFIPTGVHQSQEDPFTHRTTSWTDLIPTARADADLLSYLWNNRDELIRLAKIGEEAESRDPPRDLD